MYEADISQATVLALFLLPENLNKLAPRFLDMKPGTRIVANHFGIDGWDADETGSTDGDCESWCIALLYIVPAKAAGTWRLPLGELVLEQKFQVLTGTLALRGIGAPVTAGRLRGDLISFTAGGARYEGRVDGEVIRGAGGAWSATRVHPE